MLANKNEEIEVEKDRNNRVKNIIIHGKAEEGGAADDKHLLKTSLKSSKLEPPRLTK